MQVIRQKVLSGFFVLSGALLMVGACFTFACAQEGQSLQPHRAIYTVHLLEVAPQSNISQIDGCLINEFKASLSSGYISSMRLLLQMQMLDGSKRLYDEQHLNTETLDGQEFTFKEGLMVNNSPVLVLTGRAEKSGDAILVHLRQPQEREFNVSMAAFPMAYELNILKQARLGNNFFHSLTYQGQNKEDVFSDATVQIGKAIKKPFAKAKGAMLLLQQQPFWPVREAYFKNSFSLGRLPFYVSEENIYANGVIRDAVFHYKDFTIEAHLKELTYF